MHQVLVSSGEFVRRKTWARSLFHQLLVLCGIEGTVAHLLECATVAIPYKCVGQEEHLAYHLFGCHDVNCPFCMKSLAYRLAAYEVYKIRAVYRALFRAVRYVNFEYTVPQELRSVIYRHTETRRVVVHGVSKDVVDDGMTCLRKLVVETFDKYVHRVFDLPKSVELGIILTPQSWSSEDPLGKGPVPHVHGTMFSLAFDSVTGEPVDVPVKSWGSYGTVDRGFKLLRSTWREALKVYGDVPPEVNVHIRYEEGSEKLTKRLQYMFRSPAMDVYKYVSFGVPESYDRKWVRQMLAPLGRKQRMRYYGWLAPRNCSAKAPLMRRLGLTLKKRTEYSRISREMLCPAKDSHGQICGCQMVRAENMPRLPVEEVFAAGHKLLGYDYMLPEFVKFDEGGG